MNCLAVIFLLSSIGTSSAQNTLANHSQERVKEVVYEQFFHKMKADKETVYLVNFWATWCVPCVEELPIFQKINRDCAENPNFKMYLVSLDNAKMKEKVLIPFLKKNDIRAEVLLLNDNKRMDTWISLINKDWSGALPATLIYKNGKALYFKEGTVTEKELKKIIIKNLN